MKRYSLMFLICFTMLFSLAFFSNKVEASTNTEILIDVMDLENVSDPLYIDARITRTEEYIPGAIAIDWKEFYNDQTLKSQEEIDTIIGSYGITGNEKIVIYGDGQKNSDASMIYWILEMSGHQNIQILEGGFFSYKNAGLETSSELATLESTEFSGESKPETVMNMEGMLTHYGDYDLAIVDPRTDQEYNGWALNGEARGGHIRTAINFNPNWAYDETGTLKTYDEVQKLLYQKGLTPEKTIITYSNLDSRGTDMYLLLKLCGYENVTNLGFTYNVWAEESLLPISSAAHWEALVSPEWINQLVTTGEAPTHENEKFLVLECSWGPVEQAEKYQAGHIPGAVHMDTDTFEDENNYWDLYPFEQLAPRFAALGIDTNTTVVVYSNEPSPIAASVSFWALKYAGVDVRLMDGNLDRWVEAGLPLETGINNPIPVADFGRTEPENPQYHTSIDEAKEILADPNGRLVSIRSWPEFTGEVSRHSYILDKGEPLGAYWGRAGMGENKSDLSFYFDPDGTYRSYHEIDKMWADLDIHANNNVAFYCGTGSRGSTGWFYSYLMGWPNASLFDSGWYGWTEGKEVSPNPKQRLWDIVEQQ